MEEMKSEIFFSLLCVFCRLAFLSHLHFAWDPGGFGRSFERSLFLVVLAKLESALRFIARGRFLAGPAFFSLFFPSHCFFPPHNLLTIGADMK